MLHDVSILLAINMQITIRLTSNFHNYGYAAAKATHYSNIHWNSVARESVKFSSNIFFLLLITGSLIL